jgi:N-acyl-D-aspartate/D-glutamate deacylase
LASVTSQSTGELQPNFTPVLAEIHKAESAGATTQEVANLAAPLNRAVELNEQALGLTQPADAQKRTQLLGQVDQILSGVQRNATALESVAAQRTFTDTALTYISGAVAAFLATIAYVYCVDFYRKYRVKRTFQMKVIPK